MGVDDLLGTAAAGINLVDTLVHVIKRYSEGENSRDFEDLLQEVRKTALQKIDDADRALADLELMLRDEGVDLDRSLERTIQSTPFWRPFRSNQLRRIRDALRDLFDSSYDSSDDLAALARCLRTTEDMGTAVVQAAPRKHALLRAYVNAPSVGGMIGLLRHALTDHKRSLTAIA